MVLNAPRKLKEDVSNNFPEQFLERKQNGDNFESMFDRKQQTAIAGTKHTLTTDQNKTIHRKRASKQLKLNCQNPLPRKWENTRGPGGRFTTIDDNMTAEQSERSSTPIPGKTAPILEETKFNSPIEMETTRASPGNGRIRKKLIRDRTI